MILPPLPLPDVARRAPPRTYGYYPNGQLSWFAKATDGARPNSLENSRGDSYSYQADGQLAFVNHEALNVHPAGPPGSDAGTLLPGDSNPGASDGPQRANAYAYDAAGNRTYANESGQVSRPTFDATNRHLSYGFDASGNVTRGVANQGVWNYAYDAYGQLLTATPSGASTPTARFVYDPQGRVCASLRPKSVGNVALATAKVCPERSTHSSAYKADALASQPLPCSAKCSVNFSTRSLAN